MLARKERCYRALGLLWLAVTLIPPTLAWAAEALPTQDTHTAGVVAEITEATRKQGVLSVKIRLRNTSSKEARIDVLGYMGRYPQYYVVADAKKYFILHDSEKVPLASSSDQAGFLRADISPGGTWTWWAKYPAPPAAVKTMSYYTPIAPPFDDVPIADR